MNKWLYIICCLPLLYGCKDSDTEAFDPYAENQRLMYFYQTEEEVTDPAYVGKYKIEWRGQYEAWNPQTFWKVEFFEDSTFNILESPESLPGSVKQIEERTPYTLEPGKILIEGRSFHYIYRLEYDENNILNWLIIKPSIPGSIERVCHAVGRKID